jgi:hypothetical protein
VKKVLQQKIVLFQVGLYGGTKLVRLDELLYAQATTRRFISVRRANTPASSANPVRPASGLPAFVQQAVVWQGHMCFRAHEETAPQINATGVEMLDFLDDGPWINDDSGTDDTARTWMQHTRRDLVKNVFLLPHDHCVTSIGAALTANDHVHP